MAGTCAVLRAIGAAQAVPVVVHPDQFVTRGLRLGPRVVPLQPLPARAAIEAAGGTVVASDQAVLVGGDTVLVSGEIPRVTAYEAGMKGHVRRLGDGTWVDDPDVTDESYASWYWLQSIDGFPCDSPDHRPALTRCVAINVRGRGLVIISGCAHAGIVNSVYEAQALAATTDVAAIFGGFHLAPLSSANRIPKTVAALAAVAPALIVPGHCTGVPATRAIATAFPRAYCPATVGKTVTIVGTAGEAVE